MKFRKLFFSFLFLIPGLFFISNVNAETTEPVSSKYFDLYSDELINRIETDNLKNNLNIYDQKFNSIYEEYKNDYPYYMTISYNNASDDVSLVTYIFDSKPNFRFKTYIRNSSDYFEILWNDETGVGNFNYLVSNTQAIFLSESYNTNFDNFKFGTTVYNQSNLSWDSLIYIFAFKRDENRIYSSSNAFIYDANFDIELEDSHILNSSRENLDIKVGDTYYQPGDVIPNYKNFKNPFPKATIKVSDFSFIYIPIPSKIYVYDKKIDIQYTDFNVDLYSYYYSVFYDDQEEVVYQEINSTKNKTFSFHVKKNCKIYQKIINKSTNEVVHTSSYDVTGISLPIPKAKFNLLEDVHYDNDEKKPILYKLYELHFDYFNTDLFEYTYRDNYIDSTITVKENDTKVYIWDNYNVPVTVYDKKTGDIVAEYNFSVKGITGSSTPIAFYEIVDVPRSCGNTEIIPVKELYISFSFVSTEDFSYQYAIVKNETDDVTVWYDESNLRYNNDFYLKLEENCYVLTRIIDKSTDKVVHTSLYVVSGIEKYDDYKCYFGTSYDENIAGLQRFLKELIDVRNDFQELFYSFFNNLPEFVRLGIVAIYVIMLVILALQLGGWK